MARKKKDSPIDFAEVMGLTEPDLKDAMRSLRKDRKTPAAPPPASPPAGAPKPPAPDIDLYNNRESRNIESLEEYAIPRDIIDLESKLTLPELKFLELTLVHKMPVPQALKAANVPNTNSLGKTALYDLGGKIRKKYETQVQDKREIFRTVGLGESQVAQNIKQLTESSNERIKLGANKLAADCLRLTEPPPPSHQGVNIIINCGPAAPAPLPPGHIPPAQVVIQGEKEDLEPLKPRQITK